MKRNGPNEKLVDRIRACQRSIQANKRCADCLEHGPTYICLDFHTFICQTCSGIHREFGHKIKGISLSDWAVHEVEDIEAGGNELAAEAWLATWNKNAFPNPDSTDFGRVREFIKMKYIEKCWHRAIPPRTRNPEQVPCNSTPEQLPHNSNLEHVPSPLSGKLTTICNVCDLLSDSGDSSVPATSSLLSTVVIPPPQRGVNTLSIDMSSASPSKDEILPPAAFMDNPSIPWMADFSSGTVGCGTNNNCGNANTDGLINLDFCVTSTDLDCLSSDSPKGTTSTTESPLAEPAEEPSPTPSIAGVETEPMTLGDQLREAVLNGTMDDLKRFFKQCAEPEPPKRPAVSAERLAAFAAFDELDSSNTNDATPCGNPCANAPEKNVEHASSPVINTLQSSTLQPQHKEQTVGPSAEFCGDASTSNFCLPFEDTGGQSVRASLFPSIDSSMPPLSSTPSLPQHISTGPTTSALQQPATFTCQPLTHVMPQTQTGCTMGPQQFEQLSPQELVQMQLMITQALQARAQQASDTKAPPEVDSADTLKQFGDFGDLITASHERNLIAGL